jgi:WD40 repeat protein
MKTNCFLSGGADGSVKYWDIRNSSTEFYTFREQMSPVRKLCRVGGDEGKMEKFTFASGGQNGEVLLWEQ